MQRYVIEEQSEIGVYRRGDNYLCRINIYDSITHELSSPSAVELELKRPNDVVVGSAAMTEISTGVFELDYTIPADGDFGEYHVTISTSTYSMEKEFNFYVLPWNCVTKVRRLAGLDTYKAIDDNSLAELICKSYREASEVAYEHYTEQKPKCNCQLENCRCFSGSCTGFDGSTVTFYTPHTYLADHNGDGSITGYSGDEYNADVFCRWKDCDGVCHDAYVTVKDSKCGKLEITQDGSTPIPSSYAWVHLEYWTETRRYNEHLFREAVENLTAHKVLLRFGQLERATNADLDNLQNIKYINPERFYKEYKRIMKRIKPGAVRGTS